jgi:hypothetical protein
MKPILEFVLVEVLDKALDLGGLEQADQLEVIAHKDSLVTGQLGDHRSMLSGG